MKRKGENTTLDEERTRKDYLPQDARVNVSIASGINKRNGKSEKFTRDSCMLYTAPVRHYH